MATAKKEPKEEYAYCAITKTDFIIMRRQAGKPTGWATFARVKNEVNANRIVDLANAAENAE